MSAHKGRWCIVVVKEVRQREVERELASQGWVLVRKRGGHHVWKSADGVHLLAIPAHGVVSPGVVRQVIKALRTHPPRWD